MSQKSASKFVVFTRFNPPPSPEVVFEDASLTRQEFAEDADINNIMRKYSSGFPSSFSGSRPPLFGDFSNVPDYQTALNKVIDAQERFSELPSQLRRRFDNDPGKLLEFLSSDANRDEAVKLGLINPPMNPPVASEPENGVVAQKVSVPDKGAE